MSKLCTMLRDADHLRPQLFEAVLVWSTIYRDWRVARHDGAGIYTVDAKGKRQNVPCVNWWMPIPGTPE